MKNRQWLLKSRPSGDFKESDFQLVDSEVPEIKENQVLVKNLYLSFDPTLRLWASFDTYLPAVPLNTVMRAFAIGQVIDSKHNKYKKGDLVGGLLNWQEYCLIDLTDEKPENFSILPPYIDIPLMLSLFLTGLTAYFGLLKIGKPKASDTVLVSGAAGATGSIVGQIAKVKGARVIGIAGGEKKCRWLKEVAHFDEAIDYKNEDVEKRIGELCPNGIDVYFDNVGGEILEAALLHLAQGARIVACGQISSYNKMNEKSREESFNQIYGVKSLFALISSRAKMEGFIVTDFMDRAPEALFSLNQWIEQGKVIQEIDIKEGFENIPNTLLRIFEGKNIGKQVLKLSEPPLPLNKSIIGKCFFKCFQKFIAWKAKNFSF